MSGGKAEMGDREIEKDCFSKGFLSFLVDADTHNTKWIKNNDFTDAQYFVVISGSKYDEQRWTDEQQTKRAYPLSHT